jgi:hypothetical protein
MYVGPIDNNKIESIKKMDPHLTDVQAAEIAEAFDRYLDLLVRTYDRIQADPRERAELERMLAEKSAKDHLPAGRVC